MDHCPSLGPLSPVPKGSEQMEAQGRHHVPIAKSCPECAMLSVRLTGSWLPQCMSYGDAGRHKFCPLGHFIKSFAILACWGRNWSVKETENDPLYHQPHYLYLTILTHQLVKCKKHSWCRELNRKQTEGFRHWVDLQCSLVATTSSSSATCHPAEAWPSPTIRTGVRIAPLS